MPRRLPLLLLLFAWHLVPSAHAQTTAPQDLTRLVPDDFGLFLLVNDLRGHAARWERSDWQHAFRQSAAGRALLDAPELKDLARLERKFKRHLDLDWPTLRDDLLGDAVLFAFRPGSAGRPEQGLVLVRAPDPQRLARTLERFNDVQRARGELKELTPLEHAGKKYFRRAQANSTHYVFLQGPLLAVAGSDETIRHVIDRLADAESKPSPWPARFERAGAAKSLATLGVNPRAFDAELLANKAVARKSGLAQLWKALDAVFLSFDFGPELELRLSLQARPDDVPAWVGGMFRATPAPSALWDRFPESAVLTLAARSDFAALVERLKELMPPREREKFVLDVRRATGGLTQLDFFADVLPNLGPDWGVAVLPADGQPYPRALAALAVKPGDRAERVDTTLAKGVQFLTALALLNVNRDRATPIRLETVKQGDVEVHHLTHDQLFPPGFQPAFALKDGYLLFATSPATIERFGPRGGKLPTEGATPLLRLSMPELAKLLQQRRDQVLASLQRKQQLSPAEAECRLEHLLSLLGLFERVTLSQRGEPGQATWLLRVSPRAKQP